MKLLKSIAHAYPNSPVAKKLNMSRTGCWYIRQKNNDNPNYSPMAFVIYNCKGFLKLEDGVIALYHECDGVIDPEFVKWGHQAALAAIKSLDVK